MVGASRRGVLRALGAGIAIPTIGSVATAQPTVETVVAIPGEKVPENLAIAADGSLYFGITAGEVWRVTPEQSQQTDLSLDDLERVATLPGSVIGVEVVPDGTLYVASQADAETGVWRVPRDGSEPEPFAAISGQDQEVFPNDVLHDPERERLLVTESFGGVVYEVPLDADEPEATVWAEADPLDTESFGANGLTFGPDGPVFVAVTRATDDAGADVGRLVRVPVADDGSAGEAETYVESEAVFGADGITARRRSIYVAANARNEVVRVTPQAETVTVASGDDGLVFPSDVVFGTTRGQRGDLFVCNFANQRPEEAAILRMRP